MNSKITQTKICIISLISIFAFSSCDALDDLNESIDETAEEVVDEVLGIRALSEDLDKTSSNYNVISEFKLNDSYVSSSEIKMTLPSSVPISFTKKRYTLTGSRWDIVTNTYSGTISRSFFNKSSNLVKILVQNNNPTVYVNDVVATSGNGGSGGNGGGTSTPSESKLVDQDFSGKAYELKTLSFTVPTGVKTMVVKTYEPTIYYRNLADLYVRYGTAPLVVGPKPPTYLPKYSWTTDYYSQTPNRGDKICTISNPKSGTWYVGFYGYNSDYDAHLTVTITK